MKKASSKAVSPPSLGTKRNCPSCGTKFYDFNKDPIICPKCEKTVNPDAITKPAKAPEAKKPAKKEVDDALVETEDVVVGNGEFESVEDLEDDEDDIDVDVDEDEGEDY